MHLQPLNTPANVDLKRSVGGFNACHKRVDRILNQ